MPPRPEPHAATAQGGILCHACYLQHHLYYSNSHALTRRSLTVLMHTHLWELHVLMMFDTLLHMTHVICPHLHIITHMTPSRVGRSFVYLLPRCCSLAIDCAIPCHAFVGVACTNDVLYTSSYDSCDVPYHRSRDAKQGWPFILFIMSYALSYTSPFLLPCHRLCHSLQWLCTVWNYSASSSQFLGVPGMAHVLLL